MRARRNALLWAIVVVVVAALATPAPGDGAAPGSQGTDTALPPTDSAVTVSGRDRFAPLRVTVNQTKNLGNQAISVTWSGGRPTQSGGSRFAGNYLTLLQCWGDDDGTAPGNPGPPPEQCVQGATSALYGGIGGSNFPPGFPLDRAISRSDWPNFDESKSAGVVDDRTGLVWRRFRAVDGTEIGVHKDPTFNPAVMGGNFWLNPYFNIVTTNEIAGARTRANGTGAELFEVTTGVESTGLGCGQQVQPVAGGARKVPQCWLVVVPRGTPAEENVGTPFEENADQAGVVTSPLSPDAWTHRIAIPLDFNPIDSACDLGSEQRRLVGTELVLPAISSWQPRLCETPGLPPYSYATISDAAARRLVLTPAAGSPGMVVVSRPLDPDLLDDADPVVYAPLTASGVVIGFNIERNPKPGGDAATQAVAGIRVAELNLTPRLVAKLLTQSYASQVAIKGVVPDAYGWAKTNPAHLGLDRDFLQFNREFELLQTASGKNFGGLLLPANNADYARQVWEWVLADPEAKAWLAGTADPWGMRVNPVYSTNPSINAQGAAFGDPVPDAFPKSDPHCYQGPPTGVSGDLVPPPLCGTDWLPYTQGLRDGARLTRAADDGARVVTDPFALSVDQIYKRDTPQLLGSRTMLSITDTASAYQYGLQTARLSRAGDNGPDRAFVAPDRAGLSAAVDGMSPHREPAVREPDPARAPANGYPLTTLTYAVTAPLALDEAARKEYAAFVEYASTKGQVSGLRLGDLPPGYAPLPAVMVTQSANAAKAIRDLEPRVSVEPPTAATPAPAAPEPQSAPVRHDVQAPSYAVSAAPLPAPAASGVPVAATSPDAVSGDVSAPSVMAPERGLVATPAVDVGPTRFALPALGTLALASAWFALEITKRARGPR